MEQKEFFVSDSEGCIYKSGSKTDCENFLQVPSEVRDNLPPMSIYSADEWHRIFGTDES